MSERTSKVQLIRCLEDALIYADELVATREPTTDEAGYRLQIVEEPSTLLDHVWNMEVE